MKKTKHIAYGTFEALRAKAKALVAEGYSKAETSAVGRKQYYLGPDKTRLHHKDLCMLIWEISGR